MMGIKKDPVELSGGWGVGGVLLQTVESCLILSSEPTDEICFTTCINPFKYSVRFFSC